jgi:hypothetical protein
MNPLLCRQKLSASLNLKLAAAHSPKQNRRTGEESK